MIPRSILLVILLSAPASGVLLAQSRVSVTPYAGLYLTDDDFQPFGPGGGVQATEVELAALMGIRLSVDLASQWAIEAAYGYTAFDAKGRVNTILDPEGTVERTLRENELHLYDVTVRRSFGQPARWRLFLAAGIGATAATAQVPPPTFGGDPPPPGDFPPQPRFSETQLRWVLGTGVTRAVGQRASLRLDTRAHLRSCEKLCAEDATLADFELSAGLGIHF